MLRLGTRVLLHDAEGDVDDLIASEDDDQIRSQSGKQTMGKAVQPRSIKDKLDWSDSCSQGSQNAGTAEEKTGLPHQHAAEPANTQHRFNNAEIAGTLRSLDMYMQWIQCCVDSELALIS